MSFIVALVLLVGLVSLVQASSQDIQPDRPLPDTYAGLKLDAPLTQANVAAPLSKLDPALENAEGTQTVIVRLTEASVAEAAAASGMSRSAQLNQRGRIVSQQNALIDRAVGADRGARVVGQARNALNAVLLEIDAAALEALAASPDVVSVNRVINYELALNETVPYIGATAVQNAGFDGSGVRVAVLDTGIDYTHAHLGGSGDPADYASNDPTMIEPGTFPTAKVVGGFDFVGAVWPDGPLLPDPDPLDDGPEAGHGTHVADIIGGLNGVAPGVSLYAVKVCSSVSTACSGVALINGMDFALDPDGDGDVSDRVDVINMSLGADYGQAFDDDLSQAVDNASAVGVLTVAAAGNAADKPYVTGSPAAAPTALSVAQTNVPSAVQPLMEVTAPASIAGFYAAIFQPWSVPLTMTIQAPLTYGDGAGGNLLGCDPFAPGSLAGQIVLVDRGVCNFTLKISNISQAGGEAGIIGLVAPGDPFSGGDGGDRPIDIPGYMISQADANALKSGLPDTVVRFDPDVGIPLIMHMVGGSSRGPTMLTNIVKPEIGAPGASVSAIAGSGTDTGPFGGTSGAAPMVTGSAALLIQAHPNRSWAEIKALLMNTAETDIINKAALDGGELAPISRIGGGEVRVDRALESPIAAWDARARTGALSFGFHDVSERTLALRRTVTVRNYTNDSLMYQITPTFRYQDDADNGAVQVSAPDRVRVPANGTANFTVVMRIDGRLLREWAMNSGSQGANGDALTFNEYDGYLWLDNMATSADDDNPAHLAWHVLPRQASDVVIRGSGNQRHLQNRGVGEAFVESYSLIGVSDNLPEGGPGEQSPTPDLRFVGYATFPVPAGFCSADPSFVMAFAVNTWEPQTHANAPALFEFDLDVDQDGTLDFAVFNFDLSLSGGLSDGRNVTWALDLSTGIASAFFFTDHDTNSGNTVLLICGEQIGMNASNFFEPMDVSVFAADFYFGGPFDFLTGITISPLGERFLGVFDGGGVGFTTIPSRGRDRLTILDFGPGTNNTETGLLLMYRQGAGGPEAVALRVRP